MLQVERADSTSKPWNAVIAGRDIELARAVAVVMAPGTWASETANSCIIDDEKGSPGRRGHGRCRDRALPVHRNGSPLNCVSSANRRQRLQCDIRHPRTGPPKPRSFALHRERMVRTSILVMISREPRIAPAANLEVHHFRRRSSGALDTPRRHRSSRRSAFYLHGVARGQRAAPYHLHPSPRPPIPEARNAGCRPCGSARIEHSHVPR